MTYVLLANIGNSDLQFRNREDHLKDENGKPLQSRQLGETIRDNINQYANAIELPLIEGALQWMKEQYGCEPKDITFHLFASDQDKRYTDESQWAKDTQPVAEAIREYLNKHYQTPKKQVRIHTIDGNPSDYRNALVFYQNKLPEVAKRITEQTRVHIEISGGTPAMTAMLILIGVDAFGSDVITLYVTPKPSQTHQIQVSQALYARKSRDILRTQLDLYAYASALKTIDTDGDLIVDNQKQLTLVKHLLGYADRRIAFDYKRAQAELQEAQTIATGKQQAQIRFWQHALSDPNTHANIAELIHIISIKQQLGEYANITQLVFRFQESTLRYMLEQIGIEFGKSDEYVSAKWVDAQDGLRDFLNDYRRNAKGQKLGEKQKIDTTRSLNRFSLGAIVDFYVTKPDWAHWQEATEKLFALSEVADLRNKGISGHGFEGIGQEDLERDYGADMDTLLNDITQIHNVVFNTQIGDNPYIAINALIRDLIETNA